MGIFLKHLWLIPNILKWQDYKIFTNLVPSQTPSRSSHWRCSVKKGVLKNLQNFTGKHMLESLLNKVAGHCVCHFLEKRLQHICFPVKFRTFLRTPILKNFCERLFLSFLGFAKLNHNVSLGLSWRHRALYNNIISC